LETLGAGAAAIFRVLFAASAAKAFARLFKVLGEFARAFLEGILH
jgi:hypothetical protein